MNGIDEIISRIKAEANASELSMRAEFEEKKKQIETARDQAVDELVRRAKETAAADCKTETARAETRAATTRRDVILAEKGKLIESVFELAAKAFETMDKDEYLSVMGKLLSEAVKDDALAGGHYTLTVAENAPADGKELCDYAKISPEKLVSSGEIPAGFILTTDTVEICCTPEKLIDSRKAELLPLVTEALFGK